MIYSFILGNIFLLGSFLYYLYWPVKQNVQSFYPEIGLILFLVSIFIFLYSIVRSKMKKNEVKGLLVSLYVFIVWVIYQFSLISLDIVKEIRKDVEIDSITGFKSPTVHDITRLDIPFIDVPEPLENLLFDLFAIIPDYYNYLLLLTVLSIIINMKALPELRHYIKTSYSKFRTLIPQEIKIAFLLSSFIFLIVYLTIFIPFWLIKSINPFILSIIIILLISVVLSFYISRSNGKQEALIFIFKIVTSILISLFLIILFYILGNLKIDGLEILTDIFGGLKLKGLDILLSAISSPVIINIQLLIIFIFALMANSLFLLYLIKGADLKIKQLINFSNFSFTIPFIVVFFIPVLFLDNESEFILPLLLSFFISIVFFLISMNNIINNQYFNIDKEKFFIKRNTFFLGSLLILIFSILVNVVNLTLFSRILLSEPYFWRLRDLIIETLFSSMVYLQIALGITIVYKILKFANFASAEYVTFGAYIAILIGDIATNESVWGTVTDFFSPPFSWIIDFIIIIIFSFIFTALIAIFFDQVMFKRLRKKEASPATLMISSFALGLALRMVFQQIFSPTPLTVSPHFLDLRNTRLLDDQILRILLIISVLLFAFLFQILLYKSLTGKKMRAVSDNEDLAMISGIKSERVYFLVWIIAAGFAGVAGLIYTSYPIGTPKIDPGVGFLLLLPAFAVVVLGGIGSFEGVVLASLIIGFTENIGVIFLTQLTGLDIQFNIPIIFFGENFEILKDISYTLSHLFTLDSLEGYLLNIDSVGFVVEPSFSAVYKIALSYGTLIIVLLVRPYGLFGEKPSGDR
ncbi:MAG: High-affinity branched-chain amino acid transport system permease protein LivH [Candidatus Heimdallarchaeota archaeon LC_3]|nr:MAG: High-affinity branched-chain amino acid transport system permease protein LivH [Candidatus Heimdallarchaeota archaeon LC_3]